MDLRHIELLRHALGISKKHPKGYRNYFAASPSSADYTAWEEMEREGWAKRSQTINEQPNVLVIFHATDTGERAARP